jgi:hypothetical protein
VQLLATLLGQAEDNGELEPTTGTTGYAAATIVEPPITMAILDRKLQELLVELRKNPISPGKTDPRPYCWTHGPCGHSSKHCNRRAANHVATATDSNRQGGTEVNCYDKIRRDGGADSILLGSAMHTPINNQNNINHIVSL